MLQEIDAQAARRWAVLALAALGRAREEIDALNVYPVPDGDTGTNLYLTLESAVSSAAAAPAGAAVAEVIEAFAYGALLGARGNSGVIAAQLLRGWADTLAEYSTLDADAAIECFRRADEQAWLAVNEPVEGTILSVSRAAAQAAAAAPRQLCDVVEAASDAARAALARTPEQLPVLARAGVVDAGGRGLVVLLDSLADLVHGGTPSRAGRSHRHQPLPAVDFACFDLDASGPGYEVMYLLDAPDQEIPELRRRLAGLGGSLVVVGGGGLWNVHLHTDDPGAAVETALGAGRPHRIRVQHFAEQLARLAEARGLPRPDGPPGRAGGPAEGAVGLVAAAAGPGLAALFQQAGAVTVPTGAGVRPSTGQLLTAIRGTGRADVVVLPNDGNTLSAAQAAAAVAKAEGIRVTVLPTRAQVQGLAAAAVHDPGRSFEADVVSMSAASGAARDGAVTVAARDGLTSAGPCQVGDVLGVVDGDFAVVGRDLAVVAIEVVDRLLSGGGELVTLLRGADAGPGLAEAVAAHLRTRYRPVEVQVLDGGQPGYPLLIGVE